MRGRSPSGAHHESTLQPPSSRDRRRFRRLDVPICYRGARLLGPRQTARDVSLGGLKIATDDALKVGKRIEIELFLADELRVTCTVRVAWIREAGPGGIARYDAGLEFVGLDEPHAHLLERYLEAHGIAESEPPAQ